jgi:GTP-binding protein EngB required for normal cell division
LFLHSNAAFVDLQLQQALGLASEIAERYGLSSTNALLASCRSALAQSEITIAIVGRFKAGKSSFLNHFLGRSLLPVGVVPVTTVVTEIGFGPTERVEVRYLEGRVEEVPLSQIAGYVSERENAGNHKRVAAIRVQLPSLARFPGLIFVDTPGLESVLAHNTEASLSWLPNVGMALVAVSVDPPLSQQDIDLLKNLYRYTPNVSILLTKVDLLGAEERAEVVDFVRTQLAKSFGHSPEIFPYSVRPGFEELREHRVQYAPPRNRRTQDGYPAQRVLGLSDAESQVSRVAGFRARSSEEAVDRREGSDGGREERAASDGSAGRGGNAHHGSRSAGAARTGD